MGQETEQFSEVLTTLVPINGLAPQYQKEITAQAQIREYRRDQYVFKQGDRDNYSFYLLKGELEMYSDDRLVKRVVGGTDTARYAIAQLQPRQMSARARSDVTATAGRPSPGATPRPCTTWKSPRSTKAKRPGIG